MDLDYFDPEDFFKNGKPLKVGRYREVWRKGDFVLKVIKISSFYRSLKFTFLPGRAFREVSNSQKLISMGIPTPKPIYWWLERKSGMVSRVFIVYEYINGRKPETSDIPKLSSFAGYLHKLGVYPLDLHPENFIIADEIYLIDTYYISFSSIPGKFFLKKAMAQLLEPLYLSGNLKAIRESLDAYNKRSGRNLSLDDMLESVCRHLLKKSLTRSRDAFKVFLKRNGRIYWGNVGELEKLEKELDKGLLLKRSSKVLTFKVNDAVVKTSKSCFFLKTRGEKSWKGIYLLNNFSIPSPRGIGLLVERNFLKKQGFFAMEFVRGSSLKSFLKEEWPRMPGIEKKKTVKEMAHILGNLYLRNLLHTDLKGANILWNGRFILLDPESVIVKRVGGKEVLKNILQLEKSVGDLVDLSFKRLFLKELARYLRLLPAWTTIKKTLRFYLKGTGSFFKQSKRLS